jgi:hypothetical protein
VVSLALTVFWAIVTAGRVLFTASSAVRVLSANSVGVTLMLGWLSTLMTRWTDCFMNQPQEKTSRLQGQLTLSRGHDALTLLVI